MSPAPLVADTTAFLIILGYLLFMMYLPILEKFIHYLIKFFKK
jgi:hypothetical protein